MQKQPTYNKVKLTTSGIQEKKNTIYAKKQETIRLSEWKHQPVEAKPEMTQMAELADQDVETVRVMCGT